ncbi:hypothetical protein EDB92DRAFT_2033839 [Lactarius akahatsu]|uniref:Uncharacterized protein n=1 Tax=Lactarius akahatsu TaxID=416441 RepID=A0AAD4QA18_9AGAM|nr:hypothetical protein EDB92DRAFT_2033839 [Lactarius akahatsu]
MYTCTPSPLLPRRAVIAAPGQSKRDSDDHHCTCNHRHPRASSHLTTAALSLGSLYLVVTPFAGTSYHDCNHWHDGHEDAAGDELGFGPVSFRDLYAFHFSLKLTLPLQYSPRSLAATAAKSPPPPRHTCTCALPLEAHKPCCRLATRAPRASRPQGSQVVPAIVSTCKARHAITAHKSCYNAIPPRHHLNTARKSRHKASDDDDDGGGKAVTTTMFKAAKTKTTRASTRALAVPQVPATSTTPSQTLKVIQKNVGSLQDPQDPVSNLISKSSDNSREFRNDIRPMALMEELINQILIVFVFLQIQRLAYGGHSKVQAFRTALSNAYWQCPLQHLPVSIRDGHALMVASKRECGVLCWRVLLLRERWVYTARYTVAHMALQHCTSHANSDSLTDEILLTLGALVSAVLFLLREHIPSHT